jgi:phenylpyruvate tautomerase PptA (4-oxalocrotonate tautomerase family)
MPIVEIKLVARRHEAAIKRCVEGVARVIHESLDARLTTMRVIAIQCHTARDERQFPGEGQDRRPWHSGYRLRLRERAVTFGAIYQRRVARRGMCPPDACRWSASCSVG